MCTSKPLKVVITMYIKNKTKNIEVTRATTYYKAMTKKYSLEIVSDCPVVVS